MLHPQAYIFLINLISTHYKLLEFAELPVLSMQIKNTKNKKSKNKTNSIFRIRVVNMLFLIYKETLP
jgi:hypothetical protein